MFSTECVQHPMFKSSIAKSERGQSVHKVLTIDLKGRQVYLSEHRVLVPYTWVAVIEYNSS